MGDISNRSLALVLAAAIVISLGATVYTLNYINEPGVSYPTGRATSGQGRVNLTVQSTLSILLEDTTVEFGTGWINSTKAACVNQANLTAGWNYSNQDGCWVSITGEKPTCLRIMNDGNQNATVKLTGPNVTAYFSNAGTAAYRNFTWKARNNKTDSCKNFTNAYPSGANYTFNTFNGTQMKLCDNFQYLGTANEMCIDFNVIIPFDLPTGNYQNTTIQFDASAATG